MRFDRAAARRTVVHAVPRPADQRPLSASDRRDWRLFILAEDPFEQANQVFNERYWATGALHRLLGEWSARTSDYFPLRTLRCANAAPRPISAKSSSPNAAPGRESLQRHFEERPAARPGSRC